MDIIRHISAIALFEGLPPEQHRDLATVAMEKSFKRGVTIFSEGDPGTGFFILLTGRVKIFKLSAEGKEQILHIFGPGEPFGEVPVFEGRRFPAHAMALEDSNLLFIPRAGFVELIKRNPSLALSMLAVLSRRLRRFTVMVDNLSLKEVPGRLAMHLLYLSEQADGADTVELDIPKGQLAALLGTIPETFSRILKKMVIQGFIKADGAHITILDRESLVDVAEGVRRL
jgi:CRP/FNR family transcriptional regulator, dissimilatory nitrate respiration regulator